MEKQFCISHDELKQVNACLKAAVCFGFVEKEGLNEVILRCQKHNCDIKEKLEQGETVYGVTHFTYPAYLQYELTRFRLDFVSGKAQNYSYASITPEEKMDFYKNNMDLFRRDVGNCFAYEDVEAVIEKRIREEEYYQYVQKLLCQF